ncbi:MAG: hypothetical protein AAGB12_02465, partial [Pseudomonadota bacterium]
SILSEEKLNELNPILSVYLSQWRHNSTLRVMFTCTRQLCHATSFTEIANDFSRPINIVPVISRWYC